jgi:hypothetical protein
MADGSQRGGGSSGDDPAEWREWIPSELTGGPPSLYERRRGSAAPTEDEGDSEEAEAAPFDRSRSQLRAGLGELPDADAESPLEGRIQEARKRAGELEQRIRETEERVAQALGELDQVD